MAPLFNIDINLDRITIYRRKNDFKTVTNLSPLWVKSIFSERNLRFLLLLLASGFASASAQARLSPWEGGGKRP